MRSLLDSSVTVIGRTSEISVDGNELNELFSKRSTTWLTHQTPNHTGFIESLCRTCEGGTWFPLEFLLLPRRCIYSPIILDPFSSTLDSNTGLQGHMRWLQELARWTLLSGLKCTEVASPLSLQMFAANKIVDDGESFTLAC